MQSNMDRLILAALEEDIPTEDLSTNAIITGYTKGKAELLCKQDGIIAGLDVFARTFALLDDATEVIFHFQDGDAVKSGDLLAEVIGDIRVILSGERTALNYLQRMSGIATHTRKIVDLLEGSGITLLDTRKTTPNNRIFEKYAVKVGGGSNHRFSLSDGIMLKDNHIAAAGGIKQAVAAAQAYASFVHKIEVEVENLDMVKEAIEAKSDIIMLDNMTPVEMKEAVILIDGRALVECSGNLTVENIAALRDTGVDYLSSGALTHSSEILDLSLKNLERI
ncbi:nicotinate-nucleotide diphosphorylase (carboxylating) [Sedimentibacter sp. SX930]|nr:nicotinate-nucleotide diphosphorylase (carboxylating) [Sedimentibacter sp. SX930]